MKTKIQSQIINILGAIAILSLVEILLIQLLVTNYDFTVLTTLILIPSNVVAALGGFITGKASTIIDEKNNKDLGEETDGGTGNTDQEDGRCGNSEKQ